MNAIVVVCVYELKEAIAEDCEDYLARKNRLWGGWWTLQALSQRSSLVLVFDDTINSNANSLA